MSLKACKHMPACWELQRWVGPRTGALPNFLAFIVMLENWSVRWQCWWTHFAPGMHPSVGHGAYASVCGLQRDACRGRLLVGS